MTAIYTCTNCGHEVTRTTTVCPSCGVRLVYVKCGHCGFTGSSSDFPNDRCPECHGHVATSPSDNIEFPEVNWTPLGRWVVVPLSLLLVVFCMGLFIATYTGSVPENDVDANRLGSSICIGLGLWILIATRAGLQRDLTTGEKALGVLCLAPGMGLTVGAGMHLIGIMGSQPFAWHAPALLLTVGLLLMGAWISVR